MLVSMLLIIFPNGVSLSTPSLSSRNKFILRSRSSRLRFSARSFLSSASRLVNSSKMTLAFERLLRLRRVSFTKKFSSSDEDKSRDVRRRLRPASEATGAFAVRGADCAIAD
uniref:Secreted RxLR effector protein 81 n=1 Tax=Plasmopara viticola TaxID=143451 RepID=RLR81_PLAVT|nr:RecName: Full=Secreted RxLR effector protein 81; Flags: Precursor [Plasmopara viticola]